MSRTRRSATLAALALAPLLLVGCTHAAAPTTTTAPAATEATTSATPFQIMCTPVVGDPSPKPCTQAEYDKLRQQRMDYADAEKVYRAFFDEDVKLLKSGGLATPEVRLLLAGPMVASYQKETQSGHDSGVTVEGDVHLAYVRPSASPPYAGSEIALDTCVDGSSARSFTNGVFSKTLPILKGQAYLTRVDGSFKVWWTYAKEAASC